MDTKNVIAAISLSAAVIILYSLFFQPDPSTVKENLTEGQTLSVLADGATHPDVTVASGQVTLDRSAKVVHFGLKYTSTLQTMRVDAGATLGTSQGKTKRIY